MAEFDRDFLIGHGVPEDQAETVLEAHEAALRAAVEGTVSEEEARRRVDEATEGLLTEAEARSRIEEALLAAPKGVDEEVYRQVAAERDMLRAIGGEAFEDVKPKFREQVYALLDLGDKARPVEEQMAAIREKYEEFFIGGGRAQRLPRFGGAPRGSMPRGTMGAAEQFSQVWGFGQRR